MKVQYIFVTVKTTPFTVLLVISPKKTLNGIRAYSYTMSSLHLLPAPEDQKTRLYKKVVIYLKDKLLKNKIDLSAAQNIAKTSLLYFHNIQSEAQAEKRLLELTTREKSFAEIFADEISSMRMKTTHRDNLQIEKLKKDLYPS